MVEVVAQIVKLRVWLRAAETVIGAGCLAKSGADALRQTAVMCSLQNMEGSMQMSLLLWCKFAMIQVQLIVQAARVCDGVGTDVSSEWIMLHQAVWWTQTYKGLRTDASRTSA
jgi:hypothetical protein